MTIYKLLSIDESGKASYDHKSELFVLSGIVIPEKFKPKLDKLTRKLKKKYFKNEEIVFHSRDMYRKKGPFAMLKDNKIEKSFWSEYIVIVEVPEISVMFIIVDKKKAKQKGWNQKAILKRAYLKILEEFANKQLKPGVNGKIIVESDPSQDFYLIEAHNRIQGMGTSDGTMSASEYRQKITSLSLVNKANLDIDIQMADTLAPIAGMMYGHNVLKKERQTSQIEQLKEKLIEKKLGNTGNPSVFEVLI
ncbi:MAG: DUF3800 domain-containing protein [Candidatus Parcubacteria bacterium]|nr:DUF3800 domain-containing protein [Candidatus Parcubacteria bacterium]